MIPIKEQLQAAFSLPNISKPQATDDMARPKTNQRKLARPDKQGRIRPVVGHTQGGKPARFQIADRNTSPAEALKRLNLIQTLYERQCERFEVDFWLQWTHRVALKLGKG